MIFYNEERYIAEAIDSVLAQDFVDFELLLVDDGSSDSSSALARDYAGRYPDRIRYVDHPGHANRGMSATRNLGVSQARGEFVAFIDADDRWRPAKLTEQVALLDHMADVDVVGGSVNYWASHSGGKDRIVSTGHVRERPIRPVEASLALYPLGKANAPSMSDLIFRRASILKAGGFEEAFTGAYEDQAFLAKIYLSSTVYFASTVWSDYRLHDRSCMAKVARSGTYDDARRAFLEWFESYLSRNPERSDPRVQRALRRSLHPYRRKDIRLADAVRAIPYAVPVVRAARASIKRLRPLVAPGPAILMYHRIANERFDPWQLAVSPERFAEQLEWLARHRLPLALPEFVDCARRGQLPRDAVAVTFDDGYACTATTARPLLERLQIPATIFVSPELIELGREFWWDELGHIILSHSAETISLDGREIPIGHAEAADSNWQPGDPASTARQHAYRTIWSLLYKRPPRELQDAMAPLRAQAGLGGKPRDTHRPLTSDEIRAMTSDTISFGSHAMTHPSLPSLPPEESAREIADSLSACEALTGVRPWSFAYPYGDHAPDLEPLVANAGFGCACKATGWFVTRRTNPFALPRVFVGDWDSAGLARQLGRP